MLDRADFTSLAESLGATRRDFEYRLFGREAYQQFTTMAARGPAVAALTIADVVTGSVQTLPLTLTLISAVEKFQGGHAAYPAVEDGMLRGYCSHRGLFDALGRAMPLETPVSDLMRQAPPTPPKGSGAKAEVLQSMRPPGAARSRSGVRRAGRKESRERTQCDEKRRGQLMREHAHDPRGGGHEQREVGTGLKEARKP